ncbi:leukotoxin LktA family filamentous adhesin [Parvularcula sp. LCG005]|uniref:leukotoxin LktA family filamentous adhesin n=1 Tax=Parvularcula sp. LCG005 TaxID=3078805 RepID=UPI00294226D7|nr:leukotoxin LktA family filamentous adhesin [Parvularcula sp. LCG005]WOI52406.1 leukotoxin LktA family filamentous adhesin [Parvularcula sp. LCG005]
MIIRQKRESRSEGSLRNQFLVSTAALSIIGSLSVVSAFAQDNPTAVSPETTRPASKPTVPPRAPTTAAGRSELPVVSNLYTSALTATVIPPGSSTITASGSSTLVTESTPGSFTITTSELNAAGTTAFNRFMDFTLANGDEANLFLPGNATTLLNIVRNNRVFIDGTLTSLLKDGAGEVGGHVIFASPDGVIVGANGLLNVGALTLVTPKGTYLDSAFGTPGSILDADVASIAMGSVPLSSSGLIQVSGQINAPAGVILAAPEVAIFDGGIVKAGSYALNDALFPAVVNVADMQLGTALVERNGAIEIIAADEASFGGNATELVDALAPTAETIVSVDGSIWADGVKITATSKSSAIFDQDAMQSNLFPATDSGEYPFAAGVVKAQATADIVVGANADIRSDADIDISASTEVNAISETASSTDDLTVSVGVSVADAVASAEVVIKSGASLDAADDLSLSARNLTMVDNNASSAGADIPITAAFTFADVDAVVAVESGVSLTADNLTLTALNQNSFSTSAEAETGDDGTAAIAFAFADTSSDTLAFLGADVGSSGANIESVTVESTSVTTENRTSASSTTTSAPSVEDNVNNDAQEEALSSEIAAMSDRAAGQSDSAGAQLDGVGGTKLKVGATTALNFSSQNAQAVVEGGLYASAANGTDAGSITAVPSNAPMIFADDVAIYSETRDDLIRNFAVTEGSAESEDGGGSSVVLTAAIALGFYDYTTASEIGEKVDITAKRVGVGAVSEKKFGFTLIDSLTPEGSIEGIYTYLEDLSERLQAADFGLAEDLFTSYAAASASASDGSSDTAVAGNVAYTEITQDTRAWIDSGARITASDSVAGAGFSTDLAALDDGEGGVTPRSVAWWDPASSEDQADVIITARSTTEGVHVSGAVNFTGASLSSDGNAIGGSVNVVQQEATTIAGVADGVVITADRGLSISADARNFIIGLTPTSAEGSGVTGVGLINVINIENTTIASLSNLARVEAGAVNIDATQDLTVWSVAAAKSTAEGTAIGIAGAVNIIAADTQAFIGDNTAYDLDPGTPAAPNGPYPGNNDLPNNKVITSNLRVRARTAGESGTLAVAGSKSSRSGTANDDRLSMEQNSSSSDDTTGLIDDLGGTDERSRQSVDSNNASDDSDATSILENSTGTLTDQSGGPSAAPGGGAGSQQPKFGFAISGSASVSLNELVTLAFVEDANIAGVTSAGPAAMLVEAVTDTDQISLSGAAALSSSSGSSASGAIAGAVAYQVSENRNDALIDGATVVDVNDVDVQALTGGLKVGAALGLSAETGSSSTSAAVAGSFSIARVADSSDARIVDSSLTLTDNAARDDTVDVNAYNRNTIGIGAGSVAYGGRASAAGGLTYAEVDNRIDDPADGKGLAAFAGILNSAVTDYNDVRVAAINAAQTIGVAVVGSATTQSFAASGAIVFNRIDADAMARIGDGSVITVDDDLSVASGGGEIAAFDAIIEGNRTAGRENNQYNVSTSDLAFDSAGDTPDSFGTGARAFALAGAVSVGKTSAGFAIAINDIDSDRIAVIDGDTTEVRAGNRVDVTADNESEILSLSIATASGTSSGAFTGSLTVNMIDDDTVAQIGDSADSGANQTVVGAPTIDVTARATAKINSLAGGISISAGNAAIGASVAVNEIGGSIDAGILDTDLQDVISLSVIATTTDPSDTSAPGAAINSVAIAGGASSGGAALSGSATVNLIKADVSAHVDDSSADNESSLFVSVLADRYARIQSIAGALGVSGGSGVGVGVGVNRIKGTVSSSVYGGDLTLNSLTLGAVARDVIRTVGVGLGGGGSVGAAGSVVVNVMGTDVSSRIDGGAVIIARNNVGIDALVDSEIEALAGAAAVGGTGGIGIASAVNIIDGDTTAEIDGAATSVTAKALDAGQTMSVRDGTLQNPLTFNQVTIPVIDVTIRGKSGATFDENTKTVRGLSVNATALRETDVIATAVSVGGTVAASVNAGVSVISGTTKALITDATINPLSEGDAKARAGDVDVKASTHVYGGAYSIGVAASGAVGAAGAGVSDTYRTETIAKVSGANVDADDVGIKAASSYTTANVGAGAGGGLGGGVAAGGIVTIFDATTISQLIGGTVRSNGLAINADMDAFVGGFSLIVGAGGFAGAAGTFNVLVNESETEALIGRRDPSTEAAVATTVNTDDVAVGATTDTTVDTTSASGAGGGGVGIAGTASVIVSETNTRARIENATVTGAAGDAQVAVTAKDDFAIDASTASASVGGVGAGGASVNVVVAKSKTNASVDNSAVTTNTLIVDADGITDIDTNTYALAAGGSAGISGAIAVIKLGGKLDSGASDEVDGTLSSAETTAQDSSDTSSNAALSGTEQTAVAGNGSYDVDGEALNSDTHLVAANVTGSSITVSSVSVTSDAKTGTHSTLGGAAIGGAAGIGAAIGFTTVDTGVSANIDSGTTINASGGITVAANSADNGRDAAEIDAIVGAAGLGVGLGAAVANAEVTSAVSANVSARVIGGAGGALNVSAADKTHVDSDASGVSVGLLGAAGVVVARAEKQGSATALIGHSINDITGMTGASVSASSAGGARADAQGASGGIGISVQGTVAQASEQTTVRAGVRDDTRLTLANGLDIDASSTPSVYARARGVAVAGGAAVGVSLAEADIGSSTTPSTVEAFVGNNVDLTMVMGEVSITAAMAGSGRTGEAYSTGSAGGLLLGAQASQATARTNANVYALVGDGVALPIGGIKVGATKGTNQIADATGKSGGFVSVGAANSDTRSSGETVASVGSGFTFVDLITGNGTTYAMPTFQVTSGTSERNEAVTESGSGGVVAGAATKSTINSTATTATRIGEMDGNAGTGTIRAKNVDIQSLHQSYFRELADASSAGLAGKSGATTSVNLRNSSHVDIADGLKVEAGQLSILANSVTSRYGDSISVKGGAGGLGAFASADGNVRIEQESVVDIGDNAVIKTLDGFNLTADNSDIVIDATSSMNVDDQVVQRASGGLAVPTASMEFDAAITDTVNLGAGALLDADGGIYIGVAPSAEVNARAAAKSSAGIGVTDAKVTAGDVSNDVVINQGINIGAGAKVSAERDVRLNTGGSGFGGTPSSIDIDVTSDSYNSALIPASTSASANLTFENNANIDIAAGALVESIRDVIINVSRGDIDLFAEGVATFKINLLLGVITQTDRSGRVTERGYGEADINGSVEAGHLAERTFDIDNAGNVTVSNELEDRPHVSVVNGFNPLDEVNDRIAALQAMIDAGDSSAAGELAILQELSRFLQGDTGASNDPDNSTGTVTTSIPTFSDGGGGGGPTLTRPGDVNGAIQISGVTAASGNVEIFADELVGTGDLIANGGPVISITNFSGRDLIVGDLNIYDASIGEVRLTGQAQSFGSLNVTERRKGTRSLVKIDNSPSTFGADNTSDLYITGDIINLFGLVDIDVKNGDLLQTAVVGAGDLRIDVPNGGYFAILPDGLIPLGPDPRARFEQYIILENLLYLRDFTDAFSNFGVANYDPNVSSLVRYAAQIPFLLGEDTVDGLPNLRDENDFAAFMTHYLANPFGAFTSANALTDALLAGTINTSGTDSRLGSRGKAIDVFYDGETYEDIPTLLALYDWKVFDRDGLLIGPTTRSGFGGNIKMTAAPIQFDMNQSVLFGDNTQITKTRSQVDAVMARRTELSSDPRFVNRLSDLGGVIDVAGVVGISAKSIDIGGTLVSGRTGDRNLQLSAADAVTLQFWIDNPGARPTAAPGEAPIPPNLIDISSLIDTIGGDPREKITAVYDLDTQQIIVENVNASGGGHIILNGQILSTTGAGELIVRNGRGRVVIDNQTGFDIQINDVDAGRDTRGIIQITDTAKIQSNGNALTTFYVQEAGKAIEVYQTDQVGVDYTTLGLANSVAGNTASYSPKEGIAFQYFEERYLKRTITSTPDPDSPGFSLFNLSNWVWADSDPRTGQGVVFVSNSDPYFRQSLSGEIGNSWRVNAFNSSSKPIFSSVVPVSYRLRRTQTIRADNPVAISFSGNATGSISVSSLADINIAGPLNNPTGTVTVSTTGGSINQAGNGRIIATNTNLSASDAIGSAGSLLGAFVSSGGTVRANAGSSIGLQLFGEDTITLTDIAALTGDINVTSNASALDILRMQADTGNVSLVNTGDITQTSVGTTAIAAQDINLTSLGGTIEGTGVAPFRIDSSFGDSDAANAAVTLTANGDINVEETVGTLRLSEVRSTAGAVTLIAMDGDITNAFTSADVDENQVERLNAAIDALLLRTDDGSDNILGFENRVANQFGVMIRIRERATVAMDGTISLSLSQAAQFAGQFAAANGDAIPGDAAALSSYAASKIGDITAFVQAQYDEAYSFLTSGIATLNNVDGSILDASGDVLLTVRGVELVDEFDGVGTLIGQRAVVSERTGLTLSEALGGDLFPDGSLQSVSADIIDGSDLNLLLIAGVTFTDSELENQIPSSAVADALAGINPGDTLIRVPSTQVFDLDSTIFADSVSLVSGGSVGGAFAPIVVEFTTGTAPSLNPFTRALLATAAPGDVTVEFDTSANKTRFVISPANPLFVESARLNSTTGGDIFVGSNGFLTLGQLIAGSDGDARVYGRDGVQAATDVTPGTPTVSANDLIIEAAAGAIGDALRPLEIALSGNLSRAGAESGVFIRDLNGSFDVGNIFTNGDIALYAPSGSILSSINNEDVHIEGQDIRFESAGGIGVLGQALGIRSNDDKSLIAIADGGAVNIRSALTALNIDRVTASGAVDIVSAGDLTIIDEVSAAGDLLLGVGTGDVVATAGAEMTSTAGSAIFRAENLLFDVTSIVRTLTDLSFLSTLGEVTLGNVLSGGTLTIDAATDATVQNSVEVSGNTVISAGGQLLVEAGQSVDVTSGLFNAEARAITIEDAAALSVSGELDLLTSGGDITFGDTVLVKSSAGNASLTGDNLDFASTSKLDIFGDLHLTAASGLSRLGQVMAGGTFTSTAATDTMLQSDVTIVGDTDLTSGETLSVLNGVDVSVTAGGLSADTTAIALGDGSSLVANGTLDMVADGGDITLGDMVLVKSTAGNASLTGGDLDFASTSTLDVFGNLDLTAVTGLARLGQVMAGGALTSTAATDTILQSEVTIVGDTDLTTGDTLSVLNGVNVAVTGGSLTAEAADISLDEDSSLNVNIDISMLGNGGDITLGDMVLVKSTAGNASLTGGNLDFATTSTLDVFGNLDLTAVTGLARLGQMMAGGAFTSTAATDTILEGDVTIVGDTDLTAGDTLLVLNGVNVAVTDGSLTAEAADIVLEDSSSLTVNDDIGLLANNGAISLGNTVLVRSVLGSASLAGDRLVFSEDSWIDIGDNLSLFSAAGQTILGSVTVGAALEAVSATDTILLNDVATGSDAQFNVGGQFVMRPDTALVGGGEISVDAASISMQSTSEMSAFGSVTLRALSGEAIINSITSSFGGAGAIDISAATSILPADPEVTNLVARVPGALVYLTAQDDIGSIGQDRPIIVDVTAIQAVSAEGDIYIISVGDVEAPLISAMNGAIKLNVDGTLTFGEIIGEPDVAVTGSLEGDRMAFRNGVLAVQNGVNINQLEVGEAVTIRSSSVEANIVHTEATTDPLSMILTGFDPDTEALSALLDLDAPLGVVSPRFAVQNSVIKTTGSRFEIEDGLVTGDLVLTTPDVRLVLDNASPKPRNGVDIQLFSPDPSFFLVQDGISTLTDEFILFYLPGYLDTQETPNAIKAISVRRNQQIDQGSSSWGDAFRVLSRLRDAPEGPEEKAAASARNRPFRSTGGAPVVNLGLEIETADEGAFSE